MLTVPLFHDGAVTAFDEGWSVKCPAGLVPAGHLLGSPTGSDSE